MPTPSAYMPRPQALFVLTHTFITVFIDLDLRTSEILHGSTRKELHHLGATDAGDCHRVELLPPYPLRHLRNSTTHRRPPIPLEGPPDPPRLAASHVRSLPDLLHAHAQSRFHLLSLPDLLCVEHPRGE